MPVFENPEGQGYIIYGMEYMWETVTCIMNYIFAIELALNAPWDEEGAERKTEGEWEFKGDTCFMDFFSVVYGHKVLGLHFPSA